MKIIDNELLKKVSKDAILSPRKRMNHNFHDTYEAIVQRLLNALEPGTYVQPHKHENPDKVESFIVLKGKILVVEFNDEGDVVKSCILSASDGIFGVEIPPRAWHSIAALESGSVVYETKEGPYSPGDDKNFATWAPKEGDPSCADYLRNLLIICNIQ